MAVVGVDDGLVVVGEFDGLRVGARDGLHVGLVLVG